MKWVMAVALLIGGNNLSAQSLPAFPGADGFGRYATGARGYHSPEVYTVTNLNDSGPGSFRDAVSKPGRFVLFAVSGIIHLKNNMTVAPYTTIAGQTAPGDGVVLYGQKVSFTGANETIARFLRIRLGTGADARKNDDASGIANGKNIMLDHMSFSWGLDEVFSINWDNKGIEPDSITIQNSIIAQGLNRYNHSAGGLIQTGGKVSILKSLYISNKTRNPKVKGINEFVNNVVYNFGNANRTHEEHRISADAYILGGGSVGKSNVLILNNYFIAGPATPRGRETPFSRGNENFNVYQGGNYFDNNQNGILDGELIEANDSWYPGLGKANFKTQADYSDYPSVSPNLAAEEVVPYLIEQVGAYLPQRDQVDQLLIEELASHGKKGAYMYEESDNGLTHGGVGELKSGDLPLDTDKDGIPDIWEDEHGLDKHDSTDALKPTKEPSVKGYLNIEVYLHHLAKDSRLHKIK